MPALLAPLISQGLAAIGVLVTAAQATAIASGIIFASTIAYGAVQQRRMKEAARRQGNANLQDRTVSIIAADAPWQIIYGEATVGAVISDMLTSGNKDQYKHVIHIWAAHECHAIEDILIKGESIGALDSGGNVTGGKWFRTRRGNASQQVSFNGSGSATLTHAPSTVHSVSKQTLVDYGEGDRQLITDQVYDISALSISGKTITAASLAGLTATVTYDYVASGKPLLRVHHHLGQPAQTADATLLAELGSAWSVNDRLGGLCYSVIRYDLTEPEFQGGPLQATARIKGRKCYDPRTGVTAWTPNNALCTADFLTSEWGKGALSAQMIWPSVSASANACDEEISPGVKRYTCNGSFKTDQDTDTTLTQLCQSMAGFAVYSGAWSLQAGVYTAPVMALTDADNAGGVEVLATPPSNELFNGLRGSFYDPTRFDQVTDYTPYRNAAFVTEDGRAMWGDLGLPFTNADWRCANLARVFVERGRGMQLVYPAKNRARALRAGQRVTLSNSTLSMTNAVFRVVKREHRIGQPVMLTLAQDDVTMYDQADAPASLASPSVPVNDPFFVAPVEGLAVVSDITVAKWNVDGTVISNTYVSWEPTADELVLSRGAMQVEYRAAEAPQWTRLAEQPGDSTGMHLPLLPERQLFVVAARWRNSLGVPGDWRYAWVLTERLPAPRTGASLIDATWWTPGADWQWNRNESNAGENSIVYGIGPRDLQQPLWKCVAAGTPGAGKDGGWDTGTLDATPRNAFVVDTRQTYRFAVPVRRASGTGNIYWGVTFQPGGGVVCELNTATPVDNAYFLALASAPALHRWYLMVGYVFPAGSTGLTDAGAGIYDMETGALVEGGTNFCWDAAAKECSTRAFLYYASNGATQYFGYPTVELMEGYQVPDFTYLGVQQVTAGDIVDSSTTSGSTGSPGASVSVIPAVGPTIVTSAVDELDFVVNGYVELTFWSQAVIGRVEVFLKYRPTSGGSYIEVGLRRRFLTPTDVYTNALRVSLDKVETVVKPGEGSWDFELECRITWINAAGATVQCAKDFDVDFCQWLVTKRRH